MLGTNDLKVRLHRSAAQIADAVGGLVDDIETYASGPPKVIVVSPIQLDDQQRWYPQAHDGEFDDSSVRTSAQLPAALRRVASARGVLFADAASVAHAGADDIHLSPTHTTPGRAHRRHDRHRTRTGPRGDPRIARTSPIQSLS
jgi:hypothetical protein